MTVSITLLAGLVAAAFGAGFIDAIAGGGGLVTVPSLLLAGLPPRFALGTNKGQSVFGAIASFVTYYRQGGIDRRTALPGFALGFAGSTFGALLVLAIDASLLRPIVAVLLPCAAVATAIVRPREGRERKWPASFRLVIAVVLGFYDGFFGPGTGTFLIALYALFFAEPLRSASANAKVVNLGSNVAAVLVFASRGNIRFDLALPMAAANALGAALGARLAWKKGTPLIRSIVILVAFSVAGRLVYDMLRGRR